MSYLDDLDEDEVAEAQDLGAAYLDQLCGYSVKRDDYETQAEVAWDLGVSLPDGHPFAPVVDGGAAA